jgi:hypothetical protein
LFSGGFGLKPYSPRPGVAASPQGGEEQSILGAVNTVSRFIASLQALAATCDEAGEITAITMDVAADGRLSGEGTITLRSRYSEAKAAFLDLGNLIGA